jgi:hypothetical protein
MEGAGHDLVPLKRVMSREAAMNAIVESAETLVALVS